MLVVPDKTSAYFDVDDTLVLHDRIDETNIDKSVVVFDLNGMSCRLLPHLPHIDALRQHKKDGCNIIVWSQQGSIWASSVVKALKLENFVDVCVCKPHIYYDDLTPEYFMGQHVYLKEDGLLRRKPLDPETLAAIDNIAVDSIK